MKTAFLVIPVIIIASGAYASPSTPPVKSAPQPGQILRETKPLSGMKASDVEPVLPAVVVPVVPSSPAAATVTLPLNESSPGQTPVQPLPAPPAPEAEPTK